MLPGPSVSRCSSCPGAHGTRGCKSGGLFLQLALFFGMLFLKALRDLPWLRVPCSALAAPRLRPSANKKMNQPFPVGLGRGKGNQPSFSAEHSPASPPHGPHQPRAHGG